MTIIPYRPANCHWYGKDGSPQYTVIGKNGKERPATLRDARINGWLPGYTSVAKIYPQPGIRNYQDSQLVLAAHTTPRLPEETDKAWIDRVIESAAEEAGKAAEVGRRRHAKIAEINQGAYEWPQGDEDEPFLRAYDSWFTEFESDLGIILRTLTEQPFANRELGYGGTVDLQLDCSNNRFVLADIKNRKNPATYDTDCMQLVAYRDGLRLPAETTLLSIVLLSEIPSKPLIKQWGIQEIFDATARWTWALTGWRLINQYDPRA